MINRLPGTISYDFLRIYGYAIVYWLQSFDPLFRKNSSAQKFNCLYGNPERIFAAQSLLPLNSNERINPPISTTYLTGFVPQGAYNIPQYLKFNQVNYLPNGQIDALNSYRYSKLMTFKLEFDTSIYVEFKSDADYILYSIFREFDNGNIKWMTVSNANNPTLFQYIPIQLAGVSDASTLEPGDAKTTKIMYNMKLSIPWAYLPYSFLRQDVVNTADTVNTQIDEVNGIGLSLDVINQKLEEEPIDPSIIYNTENVIVN